MVILFVRMWVEMFNGVLFNSSAKVILFVRMWVEIISSPRKDRDWLPSSSSWGCELKYVCGWHSSIFKGHPLREDVSWNRKEGLKWWIRLSSSSSWGCELKCYYPTFCNLPTLSSSSWGCELKYSDKVEILKRERHPLREDVSWNFLIKKNQWWELCHPLREDVSWNKAVRIQSN